MICVQFSLPVGALKVLWRSLKSSLEKNAQGRSVAFALSHHSFTRFAASNASEASLEPVENEESSITSQRAFNTTEDRQLVDAIVKARSSGY